MGLFHNYNSLVEESCLVSSGVVPLQTAGRAAGVYGGNGYSDRMNIFAFFLGARAPIGLFFHITKRTYISMVQKRSSGG